MKIIINYKFALCKTDSFTCGCYVQYNTWWCKWSILVLFFGARAKRENTIDNIFISFRTKTILSRCTTSSLIFYDNLNIPNNGQRIRINLISFSPGASNNYNKICGWLVIIYTWRDCILVEFNIIYYGVSFNNLQILQT